VELLIDGINDGKAIPDRYTCNGPGVSPEITWRDAPAGTQSLALVMDDPDAPRGLFTHWTLWGVSPGAMRIPARLARQKEMPNGLKQGVNSGGAYGYYPPCPPPGPAHRYIFRLIALDAEIDLPAGSNRERFDKAVKGHVLEEVAVTGLFGR